ncbi:bifunctional diaminohydroxyphosphoribosylaminopyrimidine deaminase/5-amino-6-(5-phosphoribosylamino)uracil reductase RibD [Bizionia sediminis]|uniref:Riboflavin biosynthesis protein RibD n=1 Tax=Bizionia sediminis TaxID=1737064 RepID=A0ABW5KT53_9FLAO
MKIHEKYITRCIQIAKNGLGTTAPNPMVGAVIVYKNRIIGEGFTCPFGGPHAEVKAIESVRNKRQLSQATLYVTLEPCSHFGKTPPCTNLIVAHNIPRVVIGTMDTHSKVAGTGIKMLQEAGCQVTLGVMETACQLHHKRFFTFHNLKRPYVILKWAETADGYIAPSSRDAQKPVWITNPLSRQIVHKWRTEEQAILVGTQTVLADNPVLTARTWAGKNPTRVVLDLNQKIPNHYAVFNQESHTLKLTKKDINPEKPLAQQIVSILHAHHIQSVIIEGGTKTLQTFINENLWDEARVFTGSTTFKTGTKAPIFKSTPTKEKEIGILNDRLCYYKNPL